MLQKGPDKKLKEGESKANSEDSDSEEENEEGSIRDGFTKFIRTAQHGFFHPDKPRQTYDCKRRLEQLSLTLSRVVFGDILEYDYIPNQPATPPTSKKGKRRAAKLAKRSKDHNGKVKTTSTIKFCEFVLINSIIHLTDNISRV